MALLDFGKIPTGKVNFDPNTYPWARQKARREGRAGNRARNARAEGLWLRRAEPRGYSLRGQLEGGEKAGPSRGGGASRASLPVAAVISCRVVTSGGLWGGRCAVSGRYAEPPLECAERGCRRARGEERTPRRRGTARRGSSPPRAPGPAVRLPPCFILSFNLFFPHLYFDPLGFFFSFLSYRAFPRPSSLPLYPAWIFLLF